MLLWLLRLITDFRLIPDRCLSFRGAAEIWLSRNLKKSLNSMFFRNLADLEKTIVSVERIKEYQNTLVEAPFEIPENDPPPTW